MKMPAPKLLMTEAQFTDAVIDLAKYRGWMVCHFRPARTVKGWRTPVQGDKGFPDLVLARQGQVLFVELKIGTNNLRPDQARWADQLGTLLVWRPADLRDVIPGLLR
jgi:hypothetical protein